MKPSKNFFDLVKHIEGLKLKAYQDEGNVWTMGYGTTVYPDGKKVKEGDICTEIQAENYLTHHVSSIKLPQNLTQPQFDACLDFVYNLGVGSWNSSSLKKDILAGAKKEIIEKDFLMWNKSKINGVKAERPGLTRRRKCEFYLYSQGKNHPTFYE